MKFAGRNLFNKLFKRNEDFISFKMTDEFLTYNHITQEKHYSPNYKRGLNVHKEFGFKCETRFKVLDRATNKTNEILLKFETDGYRSSNLTLIELDCMVKHYEQGDLVLKEAISKLTPVIHIPEGMTEVIDVKFISEEFKMEL